MTRPATEPTPVAKASPRKRRIAIVASKGTLDQAYPPMILASTAVSLGWEAGIY
ncbi:MAG: DsrE/DsrF/DrsH-like family protein, partial [Acidimicrobiia bacterium]